MLRGTLCALATVAGLSIVPSAEAGPPTPYAGYGGGYPSYRHPGYGRGYPGYRPAYPVYRPHHQHFRVVYRSCAAEPWRTYGSYHSDAQAHQIERHLRRSGYEAYVQH